jgi:sterol desaturase/sphingolipid hydroxylase (fatty acid hydroxylase superfamily)
MPLTGTGVRRDLLIVEIHRSMHQVRYYLAFHRHHNQIQIFGSHHRSWHLRSPITRGGFVFALQ